MKALSILLLVGMVGCGTVMHRTVRTEKPNRIDWNSNSDFQDGDFSYDRWCGYVAADEDAQSWTARAWGDENHKERRYHSKAEAIGYVEQWCKP